MKLPVPLEEFFTDQGGVSSHSEEGKKSFKNYCRRRNLFGEGHSRPSKTAGGNKAVSRPSESSLREWLAVNGPFQTISAPAIAQSYSHTLELAEAGVGHTSQEWHEKVNFLSIQRKKNTDSWTLMSNREELNHTNIWKCCPSLKRSFPTKTSETTSNCFLSLNLKHCHFIWRRHLVPLQLYVNPGAKCKSFIYIYI